MHQQLHIHLLEETKKSKSSNCGLFVLGKRHSSSDIFYTATHPYLASLRTLGRDRRILRRDDFPEISTEMKTLNLKWEGEDLSLGSLSSAAACLGGWLIPCYNQRHVGRPRAAFSPPCEAASYTDSTIFLRREVPGACAFQSQLDQFNPGSSPVGAGYLGIY